MTPFVRRSGSFALALSLGIASFAPAARAADPPPDDRTQAIPMAEQLFQDGVALLQRNDYEGACTKLEASLKLDPSAVGTMLNIAICKEKTGKLATAWGLYREVAMRSRATRPDRYELAEARQKELGARLSTLSIDVGPQPPRDLSIKLDGLALDAAAWSSALPIDGGEHVIEASAPGFAPNRQVVRVAPEGQKLSVKIPALTPAPAAAPMPDTPPASRPADGTRVLGMALAGAGVVALGVGGVLGIDVLTRAQSPAAACPDPCIRNSDAANESQRRYDVLKREAIAADILVPFGVVATIAGAWLWFNAPSAGKASSEARVRPWIGAGSAGVRGAF